MMSSFSQPASTEHRSTGGPLRLGPCPARSSLRLAGEVVRIISRALALVHGNLGIRAQRARHGYLPIRHVRRHNLFRRYALFAPALQHRHLIELVCSRPSAAMLHAGNHEEADPIALVLAHLREYAVVDR